MIKLKAARKTKTETNKTICSSELIIIHTSTDTTKDTVNTDKQAKEMKNLPI